MFQGVDPLNIWAFFLALLQQPQNHQQLAGIALAALATFFQAGPVLESQSNVDWFPLLAPALRNRGVVEAACGHVHNALLAILSKAWPRVPPQQWGEESTALSVAVEAAAAPYAVELAMQAAESAQPGNSNWLNTMGSVYFTARVISPAVSAALDDDSLRRPAGAKGAAPNAALQLSIESASRLQLASVRLLLICRSAWEAALSTYRRESNVASDSGMYFLETAMSVSRFLVAEQSCSRQSSVPGDLKPRQAHYFIQAVRSAIVPDANGELWLPLRPSHDCMMRAAAQPGSPFSAAAAAALPAGTQMTLHTIIGKACYRLPHMDSVVPHLMGPHLERLATLAELYDAVLEGTGPIEEGLPPPAPLLKAGCCLSSSHVIHMCSAALWPRDAHVQCCRGSHVMHETFSLPSVRNST